MTHSHPLMQIADFPVSVKWLFMSALNMQLPNQSVIEHVSGAEGRLDYQIELDRNNHSVNESTQKMFFFFFANDGD